MMDWALQGGSSSGHKQLFDSVHSEGVGQMHVRANCIYVTNDDHRSNRYQTSSTSETKAIAQHQSSEITSRNVDLPDVPSRAAYSPRHPDSLRQPRLRDYRTSPPR